VIETQSNFCCFSNDKKISLNATYEIASWDLNTKKDLWMIPIKRWVSVTNSWDVWNDWSRETELKFKWTFRFALNLTFGFHRWGKKSICSTCEQQWFNVIYGKPYLQKCLTRGHGSRCKLCTRCRSSNCITCMTFLRIISLLDVRNFSQMFLTHINLLA